jgi:hypothetical protein
MSPYRASRYRFIKEKIESNILVIALLFFLPIIHLYFYLQDRDEILNSFDNNKELICIVGNIKIDVSKKDNWIYEDYYFLKGNSKIVTTKCEEK